MFAFYLEKQDWFHESCIFLRPLQAEQLRAIRIMNLYVCVCVCACVCVCVCACTRVASVVSDSLWSSGLQPTRLLCPWGFSRQEYWSGLSFPPLGDLPNPGIKLTSLTSPAWQAGSLPLVPAGKHIYTYVSIYSGLP